MPAEGHGRNRAIRPSGPGRAFLSLILLLAAAPLPAAGVGEPLPGCPALTAPAPGADRPTAWQGKVLLIDFWATWCPPCRRAMPFFNDLRSELGTRGFEVLAVNVDEDSDEARRFLQRYPVDYPVLMDPQGQCPAAFGVQAMPSTYLVDRDGRIRSIQLGFHEHDKASLRSRITALLDDRS